jgi:hypothetical protein
VKETKAFIPSLLAALVLLSSCSPERDSEEKKGDKTTVGSAVTVEQTIHVGTKVVIEGVSPSTQYAVVFEDDGETGYFYGLDTRRQDDPILDALHIYNVANVTDRGIPSKIQIVWSADGLKSALVINRYPHAVLDFVANRGYCRTGFPPPDRKWTKHSHEWDDRAIDLFK